MEHICNPLRDRIDERRRITFERPYAAPVIERANAGVTIPEIAKELGLKKRAVERILRDEQRR